MQEELILLDRKYNGIVMLRTHLTFLLLALMVIPGYQAEAQIEKRTLSISGSGGVSLFYGDIDTDATFNGQLGLKHCFSPYFGIKGNFTAGRLQGSENTLEFKNDYLQTSLRAVLNISQIAEFKNQAPNFNLDAYAALGYIFNNAQFRNNNGSAIPDNDFNGEIVSTPVGVNIKYRISQRIDIFVDANYAHGRKDLLDAFKPNTNSNIANDGFAVFNLGIAYKPGKKQKPHSDWIISNQAARKIDRLEEETELKVDEIELKIENLQARIAQLESENADQKDIRKLENRLNKKLKKLQSEVDTIKVEKPDSMTIKEYNYRKSAYPKGEVSESRDIKRNNKRFVNVIGTFNRLDNAINFAKQKDQEGYNPGVLFDFYRQYYYVHVTSSETFDQARIKLRKTKKDFGIEDAWIYFRSADDLEKLR